MNSYTVIWHYIANYGVLRNFYAKSPAEAIKMVLGGFSEDFAKRGKIMVFEGNPVLEYPNTVQHSTTPGETITELPSGA